MVHSDNIKQLAEVECGGKIVGKEAAARLREAVVSRADAPIIVLDMTEVSAVEGAGLVMLLFLRRWASANNIQLKLFNPRRSLLLKIHRTGALSELDIATLDEVILLLSRLRDEPQFAMAS